MLLERKGKLNDMLLIGMLAVTAAVVPTPAADPQPDLVSGWSVEEDDPLACALKRTDADPNPLLLRLNTDGQISLHIWGPASLSGSRVIVNRRTYTYSPDGLTPADTRAFLRDFAVGEWLEARQGKGPALARISLRGSAAAVTRLSRCADDLKARLESEIASGALVTTRTRRNVEEVKEDARRGRPGATIIGPSRYIPWAKRNRFEGVVGLRIRVEADGRVSRCSVVISSGFEAIDIATCRIYLTSPPFRPARNERGEAVAEEAFQRAWWDPGPPPPTGVVVRAQAAVPIGEVIANDDYPAAALRAGEEGDVEYRLTIGPTGRVEECVVTASSGSASLDAATCRLLGGRWRFVPARNGTGEAVRDVQTGWIRWSIAR